MIKLVGKDNFKALKVKGETGTLEEFLYCNETLRSREHKSKITLVNIDGFFNGFLQQIKTNIEQGMSKDSAIRFDIVNDVNEISLFHSENLENEF